MSTKSRTILGLLWALLIIGNPAYCQSQPRLLRFTSFDYPRLARLAGIQGTVEMVASIGPAGEVTGVRVKRGNNLILLEAARSALLKWKFSECPATDTPCEAAVSFTFVLLDGTCSGDDWSLCCPALEVDLLTPSVTVKARLLTGGAP